MLWSIKNKAKLQYCSLLCINLFHTQWSALLHIPGFIGFMNTPILKANRGNQTIVFYNEGEYNEWKENTNMNNWKKEKKIGYPFDLKVRLFQMLIYYSLFHEYL